jgi:hypothetical protein
MRAILQLCGLNDSARRAKIFPTVTYFGLTTISTIGFGNVTPVMMQARYATVAEGTTGQFLLGDSGGATGRDANEPIRKPAGEKGKA